MVLITNGREGYSNGVGSTNAADNGDGDGKDANSEGRNKIGRDPKVDGYEIDSDDASPIG